MPKVAQDKSQTIKALPLACADEAAAVAFMESQRWDDTPCCPRCGDTNVYQMKDRKTGEREKNFRWRCRGCSKQYSVRTGTVYEDSRIPLKHWCYAFWKACSSKKGVSALQIKRETGLSYKSALFLMHRIRYAMAPVNGADTTPLQGIVEIDETYVGGKPRNQKRRHYATRATYDERNKLKYRPAYRPNRANKIPVVAMVERGGRVRAWVIADVTAATLGEHMLANIDRSARVMTDESNLYKKVGRPFKSHETVNHSRFEYARRDVTTNTVEGWFSLLKRGIYGTFHNVSRKHLHRYVSEFAFRYNHRQVDDGARLSAALRHAEGKRLFYRTPEERSC